jgi:hypothetical protein
MSDETEKYVRATAAVVGLPIPEEYVKGTVANFERSAALARQLMDFPLPADVHPAPTFEP